MLPNSNYSVMCFFILPGLVLFNLWVFFFKTNTNNLFLQNSEQPLTNTNGLGPIPVHTYVNYYIYICLLFYNFVFIIKGTNIVFWYNHISVFNFSLWWFLIFYLLSMGFFILLNCLCKGTDTLQNIDYLFALLNLLIFLPYLFFVNTIFTFLFLLEVVSAILLYKLISSKTWFNPFNKLDKGFHITPQTPGNYINMVFFQYWVTFFSTVYIVYFYMNIYLMYGSSEWSLIQYLNVFELNKTLVAHNISKKIFFGIFLFSILFKLGITPFHLFKVEVYKGLPLLSIFFYTTYYFVILFVYFLYIIYDLFNIFVVYNFLNLIVLLFIGSLYTIILLFDTTFLKIFFTYSTIINTIGFFMVFVALISVG